MSGASAPSITPQDRGGPAPDPTPLVSVVVPAFNAERFLRRTIESVLAQTYPNWELLIVDDGSTDGTAGLVESEPDPRVRLLRQTNQGVAAARNKGIAKSRGRFIATLDADDLWHPEKLARQVALLRSSSPRVGVVYTWSAHLDDHEQIVEYGPRVQACGDVFGQMLYRNFIGNGSAPMFRRECFDIVGGYVNHWADVQGQGCEDWDMYLRCAERFEIGLVPEFLTGYRTVTGSMSNQWERMNRSYDRMIADLRARRPHVPDSLLAWSRSNFALFLSTRCYVGAAYGRALGFAALAVRLDPKAILSPRMLLTVSGSLLGCLTNPRRRRKTRPATAALGPWPAVAAGDADAAPQTLSPYARIRRRRWSHLATQTMPTPQRPRQTTQREPELEGTR